MPADNLLWGCSRNASTFLALLSNEVNHLFFTTQVAESSPRGDVGDFQGTGYRTFGRIIAHKLSAQKKVCGLADHTRIENMCQTRDH